MFFRHLCMALKQKHSAGLNQDLAQKVHANLVKYGLIR